jgi:hypothetical protein
MHLARCGRGRRKGLAKRGGEDWSGSAHSRVSRGEDHSIDPHTAGLPGRHIAEERDSLRRISECRQKSLFRQPAVPAGK